MSQIRVKNNINWPSSKPNYFKISKLIIAYQQWKKRKIIKAAYRVEVLPWIYRKMINFRGNMKSKLNLKHPKIKLIRIIKVIILTKRQIKIKKAIKAWIWAKFPQLEASTHQIHFISSPIWRPVLWSLIIMMGRYWIQIKVMKCMLSNNLKLIKVMNHRQMWLNNSRISRYLSIQRRLPIWMSRKSKWRSPEISETWKPKSISTSCHLALTKSNLTIRSENMNNKTF